MAETAKVNAALEIVRAVADAIKELKQVPSGHLYARLMGHLSLRAEFWETFPELPRKKIKNYAGNGTMYQTDTRCAFADWVDMLSKNGDISQELAQRCTL